MRYEENWKGKNNQLTDSEPSSEDSESSEDSDSDELLENELEETELNENINTIIDATCQSLYEDSTVEESVSTSADYPDIKHSEYNNEKTICEDENSDQKLIISEEKNIKRNKTRGKYLEPCQEIDLLSQKPSKGKRSSKRYLIKDYRLLDSKKIDKKKKSVVTSCTFDCLVEILTTSYFEVQKFQTFVSNILNNTMEEIQTEFLNILYEYVSNLNLTQLYTSRIKFLNKVYEPENHRLAWTKTIGEFVEKIMFPSIIVKYSCPTCEAITYQHFNRIKLNCQELVEDIPTCINNNFERQIVTCDLCTEQLSVSELQIIHMLCLDIEDINTGSNVCLLSLEKLPISVKIGKQLLLLIGIVAYQEPIGNNLLRHYVSYCRNIEGKWLRFDNSDKISNKATYIRNTQIEVNTALAIYTEYAPS